MAEHSTPHADHQARLAAALSGDEDARRGLVLLMAPIVHRRVAQVVLRRRGEAKGRRLRQDIEDIVQEVYAVLFADRGGVLRQWDPARGLSFENFVGLIAQREAISILRSGKRNPWTEDPTLESSIAQQGGSSPSVEAKVESVDLLRRLSDRLKERLSPLGMRYFELLHLEERAVPEVAETMKTTPAAIYTWRTRLARVIQEIRDDLLSEDAEGGRER